MVLRFCFIAVVTLSMLLVRSNGYAYLKPQMWGAAECLDDDWASHPVGGIWYDIKNCEKLECVTHEETLYARGYGCPSIGLPSDCHLIKGKGINYPDCCPRVQCADGVIW